MYDFFHGGCEFAEVVAEHFWGDFDGCEFFSVVYGDGFADHFWEDDHVAAVGFYDFFLAFFFLEFFGFSEFFEEGFLFWGEASYEGSSLAGWE